MKTNQHEYLKPGDPGSFKDMEIKPNPGDRQHRPWRSGDYQSCPTCQGYGGWNLRLNAYGHGKHFQASCSQCWGYGWVRKGSPSAKCVHNWVYSRDGEWNCTRYEKCSKCEIEVFIDSGD